MRLGARVRALRKTRKLSQQALAAKADLDRAFLSGIERGVENPTLFTIQAISLAGCWRHDVGSLGLKSWRPERIVPMGWRGFSPDGEQKSRATFTE